MGNKLYVGYTLATVASICFVSGLVILVGEGASNL